MSTGFNTLESCRQVQGNVQARLVSSRSCRLKGEEKLSKCGRLTPVTVFCHGGKWQIRGCADAQQIEWYRRVHKAFVSSFRGEGCFFIHPGGRGFVKKGFFRRKRRGSI